MAGLSKDSLETVATTEHSRAELLESSKLSGATGGSEAGTKRKEHPKSTGKRFKALGNVVLAMRRFQASINPTVTFGTPPSSQNGSAASSGAVAAGHSGGAEATSVRRGPRDPGNASKLKRMHTSSRNRFATVLQPLEKEL
mmetsp:Transcript_1656/g.4820  ORF Transcript_1656/g.4820 Transcript_1656/m.4820 type:complete len:141 (-) Transcript_1656:948-1370(-)|eukprot:CAMPEP_0206143604 /NCGR_PEP_ID=MMETSP1473-20131121/21145_1 /ASSEMBLY_ACC=CAM_ASM_001109 /TAXON_ID=1461547 /ORGANISM="Stichococcus sp, Strain RCC1054" /LENGTH=140 /DNA_ID=CAMNT_0053539081 /DNA_START=179 /DNA_END=601 /DNA_ORIENTATION=+